MVMVGVAAVIDISGRSADDEGTAGGANAPAAQRGDSAYQASGDLPGAVPNAEGAPQPPAGPGGPLLVASGTNYTDATLSALARSAASPEILADPNSASVSPYLDARGSVPRLLEGADVTSVADPDELAACLRSIAGAHPGRPEAVDYARYAGRPALIVVLRDGASVTVVAVGPACGRGGADVRTTTTAP
jgi:hypothetical protein